MTTGDRTFNEEIDRIVRGELPGDGMEGKAHRDLIATARLLRDGLRPLEQPRPDFPGELEGRLIAQLHARSALPFWRRLIVDGPRIHARPRWQSLIGLATAAVCILAIVGATLWWTGRSQSVSAQEVLQMAISTATDPAGVGVRSFHYKRETVSTAPASYTIQAGKTPVPSRETHTNVTTEERWGALPNRWRTDYRVTFPLPFSPDRVDLSGSASDAATEWSYNMWQGATEVRIGAYRSGVKTPLPIYIQVPSGPTAPGTPVQDVSSCYHPKLAGEATVAGRPAYIIDLGPYLCASGFRMDTNGTITPFPPTPPEQQGRHTMWIDKQTYFALKSENYNLDGTLSSRQEVTQIEYNIAIPDVVFAYALPPDVTNPIVTDLRPQPYTLPSHPPMINDERLPLGLVPPPRPA